ncbi:MAG: hypothetical protein HOG49_29010, partial [Candidatus Scalindua sp.]|nr:hypothetical protein [Candidatus Scalindua sp.]
MQNYIYQICLLFSEIGKNKTENSQRLISNTQTLFSKLRGAYKYHVAIELIKERKKWLYLLNEIAPIAYSSPCNSKVKFLFWLATSPIARNFVVALIFIPAAIYLFPKTLYHNLNNLRAKIKAHFDQKTDVNEKSENTILELMKSGIEVNTSKGMLLKIMAHSNQKTDVNEISENNILELMKSGIEVDTSKGMLFMLSGYKSSSLYPLKKYLYDEGLDKQDFVIFINHPNLSAVFQNTNKRYPIYSIYGASVVDKDKEIAIYTEIYKNFTNVDEQLSKIQYNGIPIASFMLTNFFTSAATAAATKEAFKYCKSINRNNVIFVTRGDDVFQDSILRDICEDERNNLNK